MLGNRGGLQGQSPQQGRSYSLVQRVAALQTRMQVALLALTGGGGAFAAAGKSLKPETWAISSALFTLTESPNPQSPHAH